MGGARRVVVQGDNVEHLGNQQVQTHKGRRIRSVLGLESVFNVTI